MISFLLLTPNKEKGENRISLLSQVFATAVTNNSLGNIRAATEVKRGCLGSASVSPHKGDPLVVASAGKTTCFGPHILTPKINYS